MENLLLKVWEQERGEPYEFSRGAMINKRLIASETYAWAIPNGDALSEIARRAPIIEIGAGLGYWAKILQDKKVDIIPTDPNPPKPFGNLDKAWTVVYPQETWVAWPMTKRTLFMCWVPEAAAKETVELYRKDTILWVGEPIEFSGFEQAKKIPIPQWSGFEDALFIFERISNSK